MYRSQFNNIGIEIKSTSVNNAKIYFADTTNLDYSVIYEYFSDYRKNKLKKTKNEVLKREQAGAECLLLFALSEYTGRVNLPPDIKTDKNGKPYIDGIHFNLSHSGGCAACVISDKNVGIDLQEYRRISDGVIKRCFTENEKAVYNSLADFISAWSAKEAISKAVGTGVQIGFKNIDTTQKRQVFNNHEYELHEIKNLPYNGCITVAREL